MTEVVSNNQVSPEKDQEKKNEIEWMAFSDTLVHFPQLLCLLYPNSLKQVALDRLAMAQTANSSPAERLSPGARLKYSNIGPRKLFS